MNLLRKPFRYTFFNATLILVIINGIFYVLSLTFPNFIKYFGLSVYGCVGLKLWYQPFTYLFMHGNWMHLLFNMLGLFCFGTIVERTIGSKEFLLLYLLCGILDGFISLLIYYLTHTYYVLLIGASGAIFSILLVYAVIFPRSIIRIWGIIPVPAPILVLAYAIFEVVSQFFGRSAGTAHLTHLTGFALAWLYLVIRMGIHPIKVWKDAYRS